MYDTYLLTYLLTYNLVYNSHLAGTYTPIITKPSQGGLTVSAMLLLLSIVSLCFFVTKLRKKTARDIFIETFRIYGQYSGNMPLNVYRAIAVARCPSVCPSVRHAPICIETAKRISELSSPSRSHAILVYPYQTAGQYHDETP